MRAAFVRLFPALVAGFIFSAAAAELPSDLDIPELSAWSKFWDARLGFGYKDNVTLANRAAEKSPFLQSGLDFSVARLPVDGNQFLFTVSGEETRYFDTTLVDDELLFLAVAQFRRFSGKDWQWHVTANYIYQDRIVDGSTFETNVGTLNIRGHSAILRAGARRTLAGSTWLELEGVAERHLLVLPLDDYWTAGPKLTLGCDYGHRSTFNVAYAYNHRLFDQRARLDSSGFALPGPLRLEEHVVGVEWRHNFDPKRRWRSVTRLTFATARDNASGFFDYARWQVAQQLRFVSRAGEIRAVANITDYDYDVQTIAPSEAQNRVKTLLHFELRGEKKLTKHTSVFAAGEYERSLSNILLDEYDATTVSAGLSWSF
ncbi:MAG: hypothetical protein AB1705_17480 [Verrucomicrobiota bacterium]